MDLLTALQQVHQQETEHSIENAFDQIARILFGHTKMIIHQTEFQFTELEFYYYHPKHHQDSYAHQNAIQLQCGRWYFHGSGLDLTFGNEKQQAYGGILIRGVKSKDFGYTSGPIKALRVMMAELAAVSQPQNFYLKQQPNLSQSPRLVKKSPRIGLNPQKDLLFLSKPYRYVSDWEKEIKGHHFKNKTVVRQSSQSIEL